MKHSIGFTLRASRLYDEAGQGAELFWCLGKVSPWVNSVMFRFISMEAQDDILFCFFLLYCFVFTSFWKVEDRFHDHVRYETRLMDIITS